MTIETAKEFNELYGTKMKKIELKIVFEVKEDFYNEEFKELINQVKSGQFQRDLTQENKLKIKATVREIKL